MANSLKDAIAGVDAIQSANYATDAAQMATPHIQRFIYHIGNLDTTIPIWRPQTPVTINAANFYPSLDITESDTDLISARLYKGDVAHGAMTAISSAWTTAATGQVGDLVAGDLTTGADVKAFTITTTSSVNNIAADTMVYLVVDETGTGPAFAGLLELQWTYQG